MLAGHFIKQDVLKQLTFEMVAATYTRHHLSTRRRRTSFGPGEAKEEASGGAELGFGRVAIGILWAESELEAGDWGRGGGRGGGGVEVETPDLRDTRKQTEVVGHSACTAAYRKRAGEEGFRGTLAIAGRPPRVWTARAGEEGYPG